MYYIRAPIPQGEGAIVEVVCPTEKHWEPLQQYIQKRLNPELIEMPFGALTHVGSRKHVLDRIKSRQIYSPL